MLDKGRRVGLGGLRDELLGGEAREAGASEEPHCRCCRRRRCRHAVAAAASTA